MNPRLVWALFYVVMNAAALIYGLVTNELMGDGATFKVVHFDRFVGCFVLLCIAILLLYWLFGIISRVELPVIAVNLNQVALSYLMICYIGFFISYVAATGLFIAGSAERGGNALSALFVLFNADLLFFLYYACCRHSRQFGLVAAIWLVSVVQRGWFGYIFILIALESFALIRSGRIRPKWVLFGVVLVFVYPFIEAFKVLIRLNPDLSIVKVLSMIPNMESSNLFDFGQTFQFVFEKVVGRMQVLAHSYLVMDNHRYFEMAVEQGQTVPFWKEGLVGVMLDRIFGATHLLESSELLALFIVPDNTSAWNVNPSIVGWLSIYSDTLPQALVYVISLAVASFALMRKISDSTHARDVLWFYWLMFLIPGWISQFNSLLVAMLIFIALNFFLNFALRVCNLATDRRLA